MKIITAHRSSQSYRTYPYHDHPYWEFIVGLTGSGTATIDGEPFAFSEGTVFCIPPGMPHRKTSTSGYTDGNIFLTDFSPPQGARLYVFQDDALGSFQNVFNMAHHLSMVAVPNAKGILDALSEMLHQLFISRCNPEAVSNPTVERFQNVLLNHFQDSEFELAKAEDATGYCRNYFRKLFKSCTGLSPSTYLLRLRIDFAKRQLRQFRKTLSIQEVAGFCGFTDPDYFSRAFRKMESRSPREYLASLGSINSEEFVSTNHNDPESEAWLRYHR